MAAERRVDEVEAFRKLLTAELREQDEGVKLSFDHSIAASVPWRPYIFDETNAVAWHVLSEYIEPDLWIRRMEKARDIKPAIHLGVGLHEQLLHNHEDLFGKLNDLGARIAMVPMDGDRPRFSNSVADVIYENKFRLSPPMATQILDRLLERCEQAATNKAKGVSLEVLTAVLLSQVDGFEVTSVGVSNRSQQVDVQVHNRNMGGVLGGSAMVVAEAKNWADPPGPSEYAWLLRKMTTKYGRCRLGYFVTTDRFTQGVELERARDSTGNILIVPLDKTSLPRVWRGTTEKNPITHRLEEATMHAAGESSPPQRRKTRRA